MTDQTLNLTPEEAVELEMLIQHESANSAVAMRHAESRLYRDRIRHRIAILEAILKKLPAETETNTPG